MDDLPATPIAEEREARERRKALQRLLQRAARGEADVDDIRALRRLHRPEGIDAARDEETFRADVAQRASAFGYFGWPVKIRAHVAGRRILDVGCGSGTYGIGFATLGALEYHGLDPMLEMDSDTVRHKKRREAGGQTRRESFGWTPAEICALFPQIALVRGSFEDVAPADRSRGFDLVTLHNVTEHLMDIETVLAGCAALTAPGGKLVFNHDNFSGWKGHHMDPKRPEHIDMTDPEQRKYVDWNHLDFDPPPGHYFTYGLNRIRLDALRAAVEAHFRIETWDEIENDYGRLTPEILTRHPDYSRRELAVANVFCVATAR